MSVQKRLENKSIGYSSLKTPCVILSVFTLKTRGKHSSYFYNIVLGSLLKLFVKRFSLFNGSMSCLKMVDTDIYLENVNEK